VNGCDCNIEYVDSIDIIRYRLAICPRKIVEKMSGKIPRKRNL